MSPLEIKCLLNKAIYPFKLAENSKIPDQFSKEQWTDEELLDAVKAGAKQYLRAEDGVLQQASAEIFLSKIGGILFNKRKKAQDPAFFELVIFLKQKFQGGRSAKPWLIAKTVKEIEALYRSGYDMKSIYKLAVGIDSWSKFSDRLDDAIANDTLLGEDNESK